MKKIAGGPTMKKIAGGLHTGAQCANNVSVMYSGFLTKKVYYCQNALCDKIKILDDISCIVIKNETESFNFICHSQLSPVSN